MAIKLKAKVAPKKTEDFILKGEYIRLDDLLKAVGVVNTGGHAKIVIQEGEVKVNGDVCNMRGKKLRPGNTAEYERTVYTIKA